MLQRYWVAIIALLFIAPGLVTFAAGLVLLTPIIARQYRARRSSQLA